MNPPNGNAVAVLFVSWLREAFVVDRIRLGSVGNDGIGFTVDLRADVAAYSTATDSTESPGTSRPWTASDPVYGQPGEEDGLFSLVVSEPGATGLLEMADVHTDRRRRVRLE